MIARRSSSLRENKDTPGVDEDGELDGISEVDMLGGGRCLGFGL